MSAAGSPGTGRIVFILALATMVLMPSSAVPAHAQAGPPASQYASGACPPGADCGAQPNSIGSAVGAFAGNVEKGSDAVNGALEGPAPAAGASVSGASVSGEPAVASTRRVAAGGAAAAVGAGGDGGTDRSVGPGSISVLPETGGAPLPGLCAGVSLLGCGLLSLRLAIRREPRDGRRAQDPGKRGIGR